MFIKLVKDMEPGRLVGMWNDRRNILKYFDNVEQ